MEETASTVNSVRSTSVLRLTGASPIAFNKRW